MATLATIALCAVTGAATLALCGLAIILALTIGSDAAAWLWQRRETIGLSIVGLIASTYTGYFVLAAAGVL